MRRTIAVRMMVLAGGAALCALVIACSSSSGTKGNGTATEIPTLPPVTPIGTASPELQQYFQQVQALDQTASQRLDTASAFLDTASASLQTPQPTDQSLEVIRGYLRQTLAIDKDLRDGLQQLTPPPEATKAHPAILVALNRVIDIAQTAVDADDPLSIVTNPTANDANTRLTQACENLGRVGQLYGLSVALSC